MYFLTSAWSICLTSNKTQIKLVIYQIIPQSKWRQIPRDNFEEHVIFILKEVHNDGSCPFD